MRRADDRETEPTTATAVRREFASLLDRVTRGEQVVISHMGRPVAVLIRWEPESKAGAGAGA